MATSDKKDNLLMTIKKESTELTVPENKNNFPMVINKETTDLTDT